MRKAPPSYFHRFSRSRSLPATMITGITIENFMAFRKRQVIPIRPITLIFGPNSSGKSSIFRALAALKHVSETHGDGEPDFVDAQWSSMRLGGWQNLVHKHISDGEIKLGLKNPRLSRIIADLTDQSPFLFSNDAKTEMRHLAAAKEREEERIWTLGRSALGDPAQITSFEQADDKHRPLKLRKKDSEWRIVDHYDGTSALREQFARQLAVFISERSKSSGLEEYGNKLEKATEGFRRLVQNFSTEIKPLFLDDHYEKPLVDVHEMFKEFRYGVGGLPEYLWGIDYEPKFESWHEVGGMTGNLFDLISLLKDAENQPEFLSDLWHFWCHHMALVNLKCSELSEWIHLDPIRQRPGYSLTCGSIPSSAEATPWRMMLQDEGIRERASSMLSEVTEGEYRIGIRFRSSTVSRPDDATATELKQVERELCFIHKDGSSHSPTDLGYGISTLLPIIAALSSERQKLISIEQPELHLHPAMQARLGDVIIESTKGNVDPYGNPCPENRFLIETHSEHLILRILRRIRETTRMSEQPEEARSHSDGAEGIEELPRKIRPEDVAVLYVQPGTDGAEIIQLPITPDGDFERPWPSGFFTERARELY